MNESAIQKDILAYLKTCPQLAKYWRQNTGAVKRSGNRYIRFSFVGASDIMGFFNDGARFLAIETKAPKEGPTDKQKEFMDIVNAAGGLAFVARSVDDVERMLHD